MPAGQFAPSKLHIDYGEWTAPAIGSTDTGKAWVWNNATAKYEPAAFEPLGNAAAAAAAAVSTHVGLSNPHSQYLLSSAYTPVAPGGSTTQVQYNNAGAFSGDSGFTYAGSGVATLTGRLVVPVIRPASDSTTAFRVQDAAGTSDVMTVNTVTHGVTLGRSTGSAGVILDVFSGSGHLRVERDDAAFGAASPAFTMTDVSGANKYQIYVNNAGVLTFANPARDKFFYFNKNFGLQADQLSMTTTGSYISPAFKADSLGGYESGIFMTNFGGGGKMVLVSHRQYTLNLLDERTGAFVQTPTAVMDIAASTTTRASLRIRSGTWPTVPNDGDVSNNGNSIVAMVNGTNAVNTDGGLSIWMQSSTTARNVGRLLWQYTDKTDATRVTEGSVTAYYQGTEHKAMRWRGGSAGPLLSFYDVTTPIAKPTVTGSRGGNAALASLLTSLAAQGLITDSSS